MAKTWRLELALAVLIGEAAARASALHEAFLAACSVKIVPVVLRGMGVG